MVAILLQTLPFFALIGLGYLAGRTGFFSEEATAHLTKFVFYFALSAMLFRFSSTLSIGDVFSWDFVWAYLLGTLSIYALATIVALVRNRGWGEAAVEAQSSAIGNAGFLGVPMLALLLGQEAIGPIILYLALDLTIFGSLIVIVVTASRERLSFGIVGALAKGLVRNPMLVSVGAGLIWSALNLPIPGPVDDFLVTLGAAATPGALFAIGASLASKSAERMAIAVWISTNKLILHPIAMAVSTLLIFDIDPFVAGVMIATASLPVAGNVFILAQHYGIAPQRVSAAILISTAASVLTVTAVVAWVQTF